MLVHLFKNEDHAFATPAITYSFDGSEFRVYLNSELNQCLEAEAGDCIYITPRGSSRSPIVKKAALPKSRGARIAWALSFTGSVKFADEEGVIKRYTELTSDPHSVYEHVFLEHEKGVFAFIIADNNVTQKKNIPLIAWVSDEVSKQDISELCMIFQKYHRIFTPFEYIMAL